MPDARTRVHSRQKGRRVAKAIGLTLSARSSRPSRERYRVLWQITGRLHRPRSRSRTERSVTISPDGVGRGQNTPGEVSSPIERGIHLRVGTRGSWACYSNVAFEHETSKLRVPCCVAFSSPNDVDRDGIDSDAVPPTGLEPVTCSLGNCCSIQLSYEGERGRRACRVPA